jgi:hypothetical protein
MVNSQSQKVCCVFYRYPVALSLKTHSVAERVDDRLTLKYPEGSGRGLIEVIFWNLPGGTEEAMKNFTQDS